MNKQKLISAFIVHLEGELMALKAAAQATYVAATEDESKAENQYDTRAIEASYLAGAQAKRAGMIDEILLLFQKTKIKDFGADEPIAETALVEVESQRKKSLIFLMSKGGGFSLHFDGHNIQVVTPHSLVGEALLGLRAGETAEVEIDDRVREYKILSVG